MTSIYAASNKASQIVPDRSADDDAERIVSQIAMALQNPSPNLAKAGFDFSRSDSFGGGFAHIAGLFSPSLDQTFGLTNTPAVSSSTVQPSPFAASAAKSAFLGSVVPVTPVQPVVQPAPVAVPAVVAPAVAVAPGSSATSSSGSAAKVPTSESRRPKRRAVQDSDESDDEYMDDDDEEESLEGGDDAVGSDLESDASYSHESNAPKRRKRKASQPVSSNARCFGDLTDDDIAFMDFKELTRMMSAAGLNRQAVAEVKARRRRLKNRQSARLCSNKKREMCQELQSEKGKLVDQLSSVQANYAKLQREHQALKQSYEALLRQTQTR